MACNSTACDCIERISKWAEYTELHYRVKAVRLANQPGRARDYLKYQTHADVHADLIARLADMQCEIQPEEQPAPPLPWWKKIFA